MKLISRSRSFFAPIGVAAIGVAAGCAGTETAPAPVETELGTGQQSMGEFIIHVSPSKRKMTIRRVSKELHDAVVKDGPALHPEAMTDVNLQQDNTPGSGPVDSVELVDGTTTDTYGAMAPVNGCPINSFCADVTLNSFWSKTLNFTNVEITSQYDANNMPITGHAATNSDVANIGRTGLSSTYGLWQYQSPSVLTKLGSAGTSASAAQGVMLPGTANGATKTWIFANPDDANWTISLRVMAGNTYSNYTMKKLTYRTGQTPTYDDPCTVAANESAVTLTRADTNTTVSQPAQFSASYVYAALPFDFTYYGTRYTAATGRVNFSSGGNASITAGAASGTFAPVLGASNNTSLPATQPKPGLFPWWDNAAWGNAPAGLCAKVIWNATTNVGPNRQFVIGWKKLAAKNNGGGIGPFVDFNVTFNESTEEIWFNYGSITTGTGGGMGAWSATIGAQDASGPAATGSLGPGVTTFPNASPARYTLQPIPL